MNLRNILKIYNLERQLTTDDIALLNTLRGMNESDRELLVESLGPQGKGAKKAGKKSSASSVSKKSSRAQSLAGAIQKTPKLKDPARDDNGHIDSSKLCTFIVNDATQEACGAIEDDPIHDLTYSSSHEFAGRVGARAANGD